MVRTCCIHQQQRVAGRRRVDDDEAAARLAYDAGEGVENGDLLGAGGSQVLPQQRASGLVRAPCEQRPADIAFIKTGMKATVKIDAYDYTIYGDLSGTLSYISADTLTENLNVQQGEQPYYRVQVKTDGRKFSGRPDQKLDIQPGMTSMVEIKTGSNTVLKYLSKPVIKTLNQSLGER